MDASGGKLSGRTNAHGPRTPRNPHRLRNCVSHAGSHQPFPLAVFVNRTTRRRSRRNPICTPNFTSFSPRLAVRIRSVLQPFTLRLDSWGRARRGGPNPARRRRRSGSARRFSCWHHQAAAHSGTRVAAPEPDNRPEPCLRPGRPAISTRGMRWATREMDDPTLRRIPVPGRRTRLRSTVARVP